MKKIWIPIIATFLAFAFVFTSQTASFAAVGNYSVSTYIKGSRNNHWTSTISANSKHKLRVVVDNYNKFDIRYYVTDVKTKKRVLSEHGLTSAGHKTYEGPNGEDLSMNAEGQAQNELIRIMTEALKCSGTLRRSLLTGTSYFDDAVDLALAFADLLAPQLIGAA